jgi:hypothetical protein
MESLKNNKNVATQRIDASEERTQSASPIGSTFLTQQQQ